MASIDFQKYHQQGLEILKQWVAHNTYVQDYHFDTQYPLGKSVYEGLAYIKRAMDSFGWKTHIDDGNYYVYADFGPHDADELIGIVIHNDTVFADPNDWDTNPFELTVKDGEMFGRGVQDDKGPGVAFIMGLKAALDAGLKLNKRIRILIGSDEETGNWNSLKKYAANGEQEIDMAIMPDAEFPPAYIEKGVTFYQVIGAGT